MSNLVSTQKLCFVAKIESAQQIKQKKKTERNGGTVHTIDWVEIAILCGVENGQRVKRNNKICDVFVYTCVSKQLNK